MSDDRLQRLLDHRDLLDESLRTVDPDKRAALSREYRVTLMEIDSLSQEGAGESGGQTTEADPLDQLAQRRAERESRASG